MIFSVVAFMRACILLIPLWTEGSPINNITPLGTGQSVQSITSLGTRQSDQSITSLGTRQPGKSITPLGTGVSVHFTSPGKRQPIKLHLLWQEAAFHFISFGQGQATFFDKLFTCSISLTGLLPINYLYLSMIRLHEWLIQARSCAAVDGLSVSLRPPPEPDLWHQKQGRLSVISLMQCCFAVNKSRVTNVIALTDFSSILEVMSSPYHPKSKFVPSSGFDTASASFDFSNVTNRGKVKTEGGGGDDDASHTSQISNHSKGSKVGQDVDHEVDNSDGDVDDFMAQFAAAFSKMMKVKAPARAGLNDRNLLLSSLLVWAFVLVMLAPVTRFVPAAPLSNAMNVVLLLSLVPSSSAKSV